MPIHRSPLAAVAAALALSGAVALPVHGQTKAAQLLAEGSEIVFTTRQMGVPVPQATFQSTAIRATGPGRFEVAGRLTIKGTARELVVPVQLAAAGAQQVASGSFTIRRLDYKVGEAEWADTSLLANDVQVRFKLLLAGMPAP